MQGAAQALWIDPLSLWLALAVAIIWCADFLIGNDGRRRIRDRLIYIWIWLEEVKWVKLGSVEARSFLSAFDLVFGPRLMSWRRVFSCTVLFCISATLFYVLIETFRYYHGLGWRPPFTGFHFNTGFPFQLFPMMLYMSVTRYVTGLSIRWFEKNEKKLSTTPMFIVFIVCFSIISVAYP
jgi:hypothetical protein